MRKFEVQFRHGKDWLHSAYAVTIKQARLIKIHRSSMLSDAKYRIVQWSGRVVR